MMVSVASGVTVISATMLHRRDHGDERRVTGSTSLLVTLTITQSLTNNSANSLSFSQGPNFVTYSIGDDEIPLTATGGSGSYTWSVTSGSLPSGMSLRTDLPAWFPASATAGLIGIAATPGTYYFTLQVTSGGITSTLQCQS